MWAVVGDGEQITDWYAAKSAFLAVLAVSAVAQEQSLGWPGQRLGWFGFQIPQPHTQRSEYFVKFPIIIGIYNYDRYCQPDLWVAPTDARRDRRLQTQVTARDTHS